MFEALSAVLSAFILVGLSMIGGGIIYVVVKDRIKHDLGRKD